MLQLYDGVALRHLNLKPDKSIGMTFDYSVKMDKYMTFNDERKELARPLFLFLLFVKF